MAKDKLVVRFEMNGTSICSVCHMDASRRICNTYLAVTENGKSEK